MKQLGIILFSNIMQSTTETFPQNNCNEPTRAHFQVKEYTKKLICLLAFSLLIFFALLGIRITMGTCEFWSLATCQFPQYQSNLFMCCPYICPSETWDCKFLPKVQNKAAVVTVTVGLSILGVACGIVLISLCRVRSARMKVGQSNYVSL